MIPLPRLRLSLVCLLKRPLSGERYLSMAAPCRCKYLHSHYLERSMSDLWASSLSFQRLFPKERVRFGHTPHRETPCVGGYDLLNEIHCFPPTSLLFGEEKPLKPRLCGHRLRLATGKTPFSCVSFSSSFYCLLHIRSANIFPPP